MQAWYVVHTHANAERIAERHLARQGYSVYLPQYAKTRRHARRVEMVTAPLFPRYLFVRMDPEATAWTPIRSTVGVTSVVCQGGRPAPLDEAAVDEIRSRESGDGLVALDPPRFAKGERLQITAGPLAQQLGLFEGIDDKDRVVLLLDLLGRPVRVRVPLDVVRPGA